MQIAEDGSGLGDVLGSGGAEEPPAPREQLEAEAGLDVEGALGVSHHRQTGGDHSRRRQGDEMAGDDQAGVADGAAIGISLAAIDEGDLVAAFGSVAGDAQADCAAADDENGFAEVAHRVGVGIPERKGSAG